jgi:hypothetical protein
VPSLLPRPPGRSTPTSPRRQPTPFEDHFSGHAASRPTYRPALFEYLATLPADRETAWDSATGNGQAAVGLAPYFRKVIATEQVAQEARHDGAEYRGAPDLVRGPMAVAWEDPAEE